MPDGSSEMDLEVEDEKAAPARAWCRLPYRLERGRVRHRRVRRFALFTLYTIGFFVWRGSTFDVALVLYALLGSFFLTDPLVVMFTYNGDGQSDRSFIREEPGPTRAGMLEARLLSAVRTSNLHVKRDKVRGQRPGAKRGRSHTWTFDGGIRLSMEMDPKEGPAQVEIAGMGAHRRAQIHAMKGLILAEINEQNLPATDADQLVAAVK
jgi:hypothetical protein